MTDQRVATTTSPRLAARTKTWVTWALPAVLIVLSIASQLISARSRTSPVFSEDEIGYLSNAFVMSGLGSKPSLSFFSYYPGWSVFLVPLWWVLQDPGRVYRGALLLSALSAVVTIPVYAAIGRRFGLTWQNALSAGAIITLMPAVTTASGFALSENFLGLVVAIAFLLALRAWEAPSVLRFALLGFATSYVFFTHGRFVALVGVTIVVGIAMILLHRRREGLALLVSTIVFSGVLYEVYKKITDGMYPATSSRESRGLTRSLFGQHPVPFVEATAGQVWYNLAATLGLVALGIAILWIRARGEWRLKSIGASTWLLAGTLALLVLSICLVGPSVATHPTRLDTWIYGRYTQPLVNVIALVGIAGALGGISTKIRRPILLGSIIAIAAYAVFGLHVLPTVTAAGGSWFGINVANLAQFSWPNVTPEIMAPVIPASIAGAVGCFFLLRPRAASTVLIVLGGYFTISSGLAEQKTIYPLYKTFENGFVLQKYVAQYPGDTVSFDKAGDNGGVSRNVYQFLLEPRHVPIVDTAGTETLPTTDLVIARRDWPLGKKAGAKLIAVDTFQDNGLWLMPKAQK